MTLVGIGIASIIAFLLCGVTHWAVEVLSHGQMGRLRRYALGQVCIGLPLAGWLLWQREPVPGPVALGAWLAITAGAGLGTALAHLADRHAGMERELRYGQPGSSVAGDRRG